mgnify:CR=1 FL=1
MSEADAARTLRGRARLLEFLKFRVLASQEAFFASWLIPTETVEAPRDPSRLNAPPIWDLTAFRTWLQPLWPEVVQLSDEDLRNCLEQAQRLYLDPSPQRQREQA